MVAIFSGQVTDSFGPINLDVTLDGSGNGQVQFQATGDNIRLSNIFFKVSSSTNQAVCTIYKGQVATGRAILISNSGSTGGNAKGNVDLFDGETVFVRWTGGDAGSTATATFSGSVIPFGERPGPSQLNFEDPIAAGDGSLIFPAIKSPDFQTGVSGWMLGRDGSFEASDAVIRGSLSANNGDVLVNDSGVTITGAQQIVLITDTGIFVRENPDSGGYVQIAAAATFGGLTFYQPVNDTVNSETFFPGLVDGQSVTSPGHTRPYLRIASPFINTGGTDLGRSEIRLFGQASDSATDDSYVDILGKFSRPGVAVTLPVGGGGLANNATTVITPTAALKNSYNFWNGSNNFVTVDRDGLYEVGVNLRYATNATGFRQASFDVNGAQYIQWTIPALTGFNTVIGGSIQLNLSANDQVRWSGFQNSGAGLQIIGNSMAWLRLIEG